MRLHYGVLAWAITAASSLLAADWAHWRGPEHNGISRETNLIESWSLNPKENVLWDTPVGGRAAPIILNNRVYFNTRTPHDVNDPKERIHAREQVVCLDAVSGEVVWRDEFNVFQSDIPAPRVGWASMAGDTETGNVYVHGASGLFRCYSGDGKMLWEHSLLEEYGRISGYGGRMVAPMVDEDRVIVSFMAMNWGDLKAPPPKQRFYAFDKRTGDLLWISSPGGRPLDTTYSNPMIAVIDGIRMLLCGNGDGGISAINARTGEPLWTFRMSQRGINVSPVVDGKYVYIAHGEDNIDNPDAFGRVQCIDGTGRGDITETHSVWRVDGLKVGYASLLIHDGILYAVSDSGSLHALDSQTGDELWEYKLGTVGKGSPVWADGKIYVMEVNGNVHILQPSREKCEKLSHVRIPSPIGGTDEIYSSPAIADGRIVLVTRDRTLCLGRADATPSSDPIPPLPEEAPAEEEVATIQLVPYEVYLRRGDSVKYELRCFDRNGHLLETKTPTLELGPGLQNISLSENAISVPEDAGEQAGTVVAKVGELTAVARVRVFPPLPWSWDFNNFKERDVPPTWVNAFNELRPMDVNGETAMYQLGGASKPGTYIWFGTPDMHDYTVQADVLLREKQRRLSSAGITVQRYNLILKGNTNELGIHTWAPHVRMDKEMKFECQPETWYRMKMRVDPVEGGCQVRGKVWPRDAEEPAEWTIEAFDPHPNENGSPGLYIFGLAETFFDNVNVFEDKE